MTAQRNAPAAMISVEQLKRNVKEWSFLKFFYLCHESNVRTIYIYIFQWILDDIYVILVFFFYLFSYKKENI